MATFTYDRRVYLGDTDGAGVVYFNQFLQMCHEAYESWLMAENLSLQKVISAGDLAIPLVHASVDFVSPAYCGDRLVVKLTITQASAHRFCCDYQISQAESLQLVARAQTHHVCIALPARKKAPLPPAWQGAIGDVDHH
ncbi:1,4-dihydroxy-2-naphthoyl-CoA hydrolase [Synechocystis salina LEGE 06099]|uniref:1,4-dihydroxy-2-naphthoyl-CoA hydrolase n=1 Tax=Synechocystis salina TaxID=945780 RepID=UPI00187EF7C6|nr:1,4-dihydroxy-2-naphthoyl-CoA hydrolase [Synechocystis salina]MBE9204736.1 1,4-dihydroxy-2-naphthoyl-CoA hydrolase [Synechocystis salina LEGE 06099]